jgi:carboxyl-terminal processing protease
LLAIPSQFSSIHAMLPRNFLYLLIVASISLFCHVKSRQTKIALFVADAVQMIDAYYVDSVEDENLLNGAMKGMTDLLDEHSSFIPITAYESFQDSIEQEFAGIGILVEQPTPDSPVRVITPLVGSPALAAGLLPGDVILQVDAERVEQLDMEAVSKRLRGPIGTPVRVLIRRGEEERAVEIVRATIEMESVIGEHRDTNHKWVYRLKQAPEIAYIRITTFGEKTKAELTRVLESLNNDFRSLVLDLRGNGGGLLYTAVDICDMFLDQGVIVSTRIRGGKMGEKYAAKPGVLVSTDKPMVILIDSDSASASEIVAACLQDNKRAVIAGVRSYGKGSVQEVLPLQYGHSALRLTIARFYRPSDKSIHRLKDATDADDWGVRPDPGLEVPMDEETVKGLARYQLEASYPLLKGIERPSLRVVDPGATSESTAPETKTDNTPNVNSLDVDPQLQRAVEHLRQSQPTSQAAYLEIGIQTLALMLNQTHASINVSFGMVKQIAVTQKFDILPEQFHFHRPSKSGFDKCR